MTQLDISRLLFGAPSGLIMDPVHGGIKLHRHEEVIIDHPLFQRLKHIMQLDILFYVFPGATHTRYMHSIGVMHIAGNFYKNLVRSYIAEWEPEREITNKEAEAIRYFYYCIRLAALLHDTGHPPFSHEFETSTAIEKILSDPATFENLWKEVDKSSDNWKLYYDSRPVRLSHEDYSIRCADKILNDCFCHCSNVGSSVEQLPVSSSDVLLIMEKTKFNPSERFRDFASIILSLFKNNDESLRFINEEQSAKRICEILKTIISGELDVDKMDYLLRDSHFSGCKYGIYNLDHLLDQVRIGFEQDYFGLAIDSKGLGALEDFIHSRFQLYTQLYSHKTVVGYKWILQKAFEKMIQGDQEKRIKNFFSDIKLFAQFTDTYLWQVLRDEACRKPGGAADCIMKKEKLEYLCTEYNLSQRAKDRLINKLQKKSVDKKVISHDFNAKFSKVGEPSFDQLEMIVNVPFEKGKQKLVDIKSKSDFFYKFKNRSITHFYAIPSSLE